MKDIIDTLAFAALYGVTGQVGRPCRHSVIESDDYPRRTRAQWRNLNVQESV